FIALLVTAALALLTTSAPYPAFAAGVLLGATFALKYNAGLYAVVALIAIAVTRRLRPRDVGLIALGGLVVPLILLATFWRGGALDDLFQSTIRYNVTYSGETYASRWDMIRYLLVFPVQHARVDALWFLGGLGCIVLLVAGIWRRTAWIPVVWVGGACLTIAINGSRNLPQYFVQAAPALALAAGVAATTALGPLPKIGRWIAVIAIAIGVWRVGDRPFLKLASNVWHDMEYVLGRIDRRTHLTRYGGLREVDKYSALDNLDLGTYFAAHTRPDESIFVFGF